MEFVFHCGLLFVIVFTIFLCAAYIISRLRPELVETPTGKNWIELLTSPKNPLWGILTVAVTLSIVLSVLVIVTKTLPDVTRYFFVFVFWLATYTFFTTLLWIGSALMPNKYVVSAASACFVGFWLLYPSWLSSDILAVLSSIAMLVVMRTMSLRTLALFGVGIVIYDVIAVFGTKTMLALAASARNVPLLISIPRTLDLSSAHSIGLGLGDIVIPGVMIMACLVAKSRRMYTFGMIGYFLGLTVAMTLLRLTETAQPATIYLVPGTLFGIFLAAKTEGRLKESFL
jgi:presenilin-like A22 family membrane protease